MFKSLNCNYKNKLLEISAKSYGLIQPKYFHFEYGPAHAKVFLCICSFQRKTTLHEGRTKIEAEQHASQEMLQILETSLLENHNDALAKKNETIIIPQEIYSIIQKLNTDPEFDFLSFYGDAVLRYHVAYYLFSKFPQFQEGILTRIISEALRRKTRANIAQQLGMEACIKTEVTVKTLAQAFSGVIGKCAILQGDEFCSNFISKYYKAFVDLSVVEILNGRIPDSDLIPASHIETKIHNYKGELLEYAQMKGSLFPDYFLIKQAGESHAPIFTVRCSFKNERTMGQGKTIKSAEQEASHKMLSLLKRMEAENTRLVTSSSSSNYFDHSCDQFFNELALSKLKESIGWHHFNNMQRLKEALTHPSKNQHVNYQRLEFLGDAILKKTLLHYILQNCPNIRSKSEISEKINIVVSARIQAQIAKQLNIDRYIFSETDVSEAILSDVLESLIAVIFLDENVTKEIAGICVVTWFQEVLDNLFPRLAISQKFNMPQKNETTLLLETTSKIKKLTYAQIVKKSNPHKGVSNFFQSNRSIVTPNNRGPAQTLVKKG